jgi:hypothetical protein
VLVLHSLALERRQRPQTEIENRLRLQLAELETLHQLRARLLGVGGGADQRDHLVEVVEGDQIALEDVRAFLCAAQLVLRAAGNHLALEVEVVLQHVAQRKRLRNAVYEGNRVVAERCL